MRNSSIWMIAFRCNPASICIPEVFHCLCDTFCLCVVREWVPNRIKSIGAPSFFWRHHACLCMILAETKPFVTDGSLTNTWTFNIFGIWASSESGLEYAMPKWVLFIGRLTAARILYSLDKIFPRTHLFGNVLRSGFPQYMYAIR